MLYSNFPRFPFYYSVVVEGGFLGLSLQQHCILTTIPWRKSLSVAIIKTHLLDVCRLVFMISGWWLLLILAHCAVHSDGFVDVQLVLRKSQHLLDNCKFFIKSDINSHIPTIHLNYFSSLPNRKNRHVDTTAKHQHANLPAWHVFKTPFRTIKTP